MLFDGGLRKGGCMDGPGTIVIAISRQFMSGGSAIGRKVAEKLGFRYADRDILEKAAELLKEEPANLALDEERGSTSWERFLLSIPLGAPAPVYPNPPSPSGYRQELFDAEARIILEIAKRHDSVIMGRAGSYLLRDHPGLISVFVHAPMNFRIMNAREKLGVESEKTARGQIKRIDRDRELFIKKVAGRDWKDLRNYHFTLDTSRCGVDCGAEMIVRLVESRRNELSRRG
jgi:cytidylate kinase